MHNKLTLYKEDSFEILFQNSPPIGEFVELNQTHSNHVCELSQVGFSKDGEDGVLFNRTEKKVISIKTADCFSISFIGKDAIALVHAGWRGVKNQIHLKRSIINLQPHTIITGPSICENCFEVKEDFYSHFPNNLDYFYHKNNQLIFRIKTLLHDQLTETFPMAEINLSTICTKCSNQWHSYRRNKTTKRNFTVFQKR